MGKWAQYQRRGGATTAIDLSLPFGLVGDTHAGNLRATWPVQGVNFRWIVEYWDMAGGGGGTFLQSHVVPHQATSDESSGLTVADSHPYRVKLRKQSESGDTGSPAVADFTSPGP